MSIDLDTDFFRKTPHDPASAWDYEAIKKLAGARFPDIFFGDQEPLMRADQYRLWLRWFLDGLVSPRRIAQNPALGRLDILQAVVARVKRLYPSVDTFRQGVLADEITNHLLAEVQRLRRSFARDTASSLTKRTLLQAASPPRCYICGFAFSPEAQDALLRVKGRNPVPIAGFVDVFRPRLHKRDFGIEIEHVVPVAAGGSGQDNLKLACGWCNKHKSSRVSLYEASFTTAGTAGFTVGTHRLFELPAPFWMIRTLALRGRCQHPAGCDATARTSELFVALTDWGGSPNPTNLSIYCSAHDPIRVERIMAAAAATRLWAERVR